MGIVIDFEEAKKKLFSPAERQNPSEKLAAVKAAAETFLFSRQPLYDRVFMILRGIFAERVLPTSDEDLDRVVKDLLPYVEANFLKPYVAAKTESTSEPAQTPAE